MNKRTSTIAIAGTLVAAAGVAGIWIALRPERTAPATSQTSSGADIGSSVATRTTLVDISNLTTEDIAAALPPELQGTEIEFAEATTDTLWSYSLEDVEQFFQWQRDQGIVPTARLVDDPDFAQEIWDVGRSIIAEARFDPQTLRSRRIVDRSAVEYPAGGEYWAKREFTRDSGRPFLASEPPFSVELIIRGHFPGKTADEIVVADLGVEMSWDRTTERWVVTAMRFYHPGPPGGDGLPVNFEGSPTL